MTQDNFQDGSEFTAEGLDAIVNAINHEAVLSGGVPSKGTGDYDVDLTACDYVVGGTDYSIGADTVTLSTASPSDRVDIVTATTTPGFSVTEGTPATNPNAPAIPSDEVAIAAVFVDSGASALTSSDIINYRVILNRDATTYKTNDIDTDGDGKVNSADSADNATNLQGNTPADLTQKLRWFDDSVNSVGDTSSSFASAGTTSVNNGKPIGVRLFAQATDVVSTSDDIRIRITFTYDDASTDQWQIDDDTDTEKNGVELFNQFPTSKTEGRYITQVEPEYYVNLDGGSSRDFLWQVVYAENNDI